MAPAPQPRPFCPSGGVPGLSYALEFNPTLTGPLQPLTPSAVADANGNFVFIDPAAADTKRFYRARAQ